MTDQTRWLDGDEMSAWLPLVRLVYLLPEALDRQLRAESGISHAWYAVLTVLSAAPDRTMSMGQLARHTLSSPSRLSHAVGVMEQKGWIERRRRPGDRRSQYATLTDAGQAEVDRTAPGHVGEVRRLVFDQLDAEQVGQLREIALALLGPLDGVAPVERLEQWMRD